MIRNAPEPFDERLILKPPSEASRVGGYILAVIGVAFTIFVVGLMVSPQETTSLPDRIKRECERAFVNEIPERINDCRIKLLIRWATEHNQDKLNSAYQRSR